MTKKTLYYIHTNGFDYLMTDDGETRRTIEAYAPRNDDGEYIDINAFLDSVADDSSWDIHTETVDELLETNGDPVIVIAQVERDDI